MRRYQCENCGAELQKEGDYFTCGHCRSVYRDDSLEKAYNRVYANLTSTVKDIVTEELMKERMEKIANCRQNLYKARKGVYINTKEIEKWSEEILKYNPDDVQASFYSIAAKERWQELNGFLSRINAREVNYLIVDFVDFLTNGRFVEECMLRMTDVIERAFSGDSKETETCYEKIKKASEAEKSGIFDETLPRDVFVAYSSKDKEKAYELVEYLESEGFTCFIAMRNLAKGVNAELYYNQRLQAAIDNCRIFALVSSKNSRSRTCDAYKIEMRYVRDSDIKRSKDRNAATANYELYVEKHRGQCKPRVEYLIENYASGIYEQEVKSFFGGLTWQTTKEGVLKTVYNYIENIPTEDSAEEELKKKNAEMQAMKEELENLKRRQEEEQQRLKRQQEEERKNAEMQAMKEELERLKRQQEEKKAEPPKANVDGEMQAALEFFRQEQAKRKAEEEAKRKAEEEKRQAEIAKNFDIKNGVLKRYKGAGGNVVIPDGVTEIGGSVFYKCTNLTSVTIPNSVTSIVYGAFSYCKNLTNVTIPNSVTSIGDCAFQWCESLTSITIPNSVTSIGDCAFYGCTSLTSVTIPNSVISIGQNAFRECTSLTIYVIGNKVPTKWSSNWNGDRPVGWGETKEQARKCAEEEARRKAEEERRQAEIAKNFDIQNGVLKKYKGKGGNVVIPDGVTSIGRGAFEWCLMTSVTIPNSVTSIGAEAFSDCGRLRSITIPNSVTSIGDHAFSSCTSLTSITIPNGVTSIGMSVFLMCASLTDVTIPNSVESIGQGAFLNCENLTSITIPNGVTSIGESAFYGCTSLTSITIPNSVTSIGNHAFFKCTSLTSVTIPNSVTSIGRTVFGDCSNLTIYVIGNKVPTEWSSNWNGDRPVFWGTTEEEAKRKAEEEVRRKAEEEVRRKAEEARKRAEEEKRRAEEARRQAEIAKNFEIENGVLKKYKGAGSNVVIPDGVTSIGEGAFDGCTSLTSITIPNSVTSIGKSAFFRCTSLTSITIPNGVTGIGNFAFYECRSLTSITIPNSVTSIGAYAFSWCTSLTSIMIPKSVTNIGEKTFMMCKNLTIYAEEEKKPVGWVQQMFGVKWNPDKRPVVWGSKGK